MRVVVTGATGHLGGALLGRLAERGHEIIGFSSSLDLTRDESIEKLAGAVSGGAALVHLAAWHPAATASTSAADRRKLLDVNVMGTMRALEAAKIARARSVVYVSSFEVYGAPESSTIDEDHPTRPLSDYGATKVAGEDHLLAFAYEEKIRAVALRMPAVYGPGEKTPRLLPNCLAKVARGERPVIEGDGEDLRDQVYVEDAALAIALALEKDAFGVFNIADGARHSVADVARMAMRVAGMPGEPEIAPRRKPRLDYHMSIAKAARELDFAAETTLEQGMRRQLEAIR